MEDQCTLFGPFGWLVQFILGSLCLLILWYKRLIEHPRRDLKIWALDVSKQVFGALLAHVFNVMIAVLFSQREQDDPCVWYFINMCLETTVGLLTGYLLLESTELVANKMAWHKLRSGNYYDSETYEIDLGAWAMQLMLWAAIVSLSKWLLIVLMTFNTTFFSNLGHQALAWLTWNPKLELLVVMVVVPLVFNLTQFWITDNFLKAATQEKGLAKSLASSCFRT